MRSTCPTNPTRNVPCATYRNSSQGLTNFARERAEGRAHEPAHQDGLMHFSIREHKVYENKGKFLLSLLKFI